MHRDGRRAARDFTVPIISQSNAERGEKDARPVLELRDQAGDPAAPELAWLLGAATDALASKVVVEQTLLLGERGE